MTIKLRECLIYHGILERNFKGTAQFTLMWGMIEKILNYLFHKPRKIVPFFIKEANNLTHRRFITSVG